MIFDPLIPTTLLVLAAAPGNLCALPKPTDITVTPTTKEIKYDYSKSLEDLKEVQLDTIDPHSFNGIPMTQGYMRGAIKLVPHVKLGYETISKYNAACVWYDSINISIEIDPTITIAKEVHRDSCMNEAVAEHEMKHIMVDRKMVNKYSQIIGREVYSELQDRGFIAGPMQADAMQSIIDRMQNTVLQIVEHEYKKMDLEREEEQRKVDNIKEYNRVSAECPDFNPFKRR
jgi:hypothetical protein